jgi:hypothetical protein
MSARLNPYQRGLYWGRVSRYRFLLLTFMIGGVLFTHSTSIVCAQSAKQIAKTSFVEGQKRFKKKNLVGALESFKRAYQSYPLPLMLFNIGRVYEEMGHLPKALETYERFVETGKDDGDGLKKVKAIKKKLERWVELSITSAPTGATVWIGRSDYPSWGKTPIILKVPSGEETSIHLKMSDYQPFLHEETFKYTHKRRSLSFQLQGESAFVQVTGTPKEMEVRFKNKTLKGLPVIEDLGVGTHTLEFFSPKHLPEKKTITLTASHLKSAPLSIEVNLRSSKGLALLALKADQDRALLFIDGQPAGQSPFQESIELTEGLHLIELRGENGEHFKERRRFVGGETTSISINLDSTPLFTQQRISLTLLSLGSAALLAGIITTAVAFSVSSDLDECRQSFECARRQGELDLTLEVQSYSFTADLMTGLGVIIGATGGVLYWLDHQQDPTNAPKVDVLPIPGGISAFGSFTF